MTDLKEQRADRRPGEATFALAATVFSAAALWQSHGISGFSGLSTAGVFPMAASTMMLVSALLVLRRAIALPAPGTSFRAQIASLLPARFVMLLALLAGYIAAMPTLGFLAASGLFLFAGFWILWHRGPLRALAVTAVSLVAIHLIFREVFQVILPQGTLLRGLF